MNDLAEFVRARLREREHLARLMLSSAFRDRPVERINERWVEHRVGFEGNTMRIQAESPALIPHTVVEFDAFMQNTSAYLTRNDPWQIIADCEAQLAIVDDLIEYDPAPHVVAPGGCWPRALCLLALPYASHPDWCEEWRP